MNCKNLTRCMMLVLALLMITPVLIGVNQAWAVSCITNEDCQVPAAGASAVCVSGTCACIQNPSQCQSSSSGTAVGTFLASGICSGGVVTDCMLTADAVCSLSGICSGSDCPGTETCNLIATEGRDDLASCETLVVLTQMGLNVPTSCCIIGGTLTLTTPGHCNNATSTVCNTVLDCPAGAVSCVGAVANNVTPTGGIPQTCGSDRVNGKPLTYQITADVPVGSFKFLVNWSGYGESRTAATCTGQGPSSNTYENGDVACSNPNEDCQDVVCNPAKEIPATQLGGNRIGACSTSSNCNDGGASECCPNPACGDPVCNTNGSCSTAGNCNDGGASVCCPSGPCEVPTCNSAGACGVAADCNDGGASECCPNPACGDPVCNTNGSCSTAGNCNDGGASVCCPSGPCEVPTCNSAGVCGTSPDCNDGGASECCPDTSCSVPSCNSAGSCGSSFDCNDGGAAACCTAGNCEIAVCNTDGSCSTIPDPACGNQGCTPGFWKANADNKQANAWPINPDTLLTTKFTLPSCVSSCKSKTGNILFTNLTLRQALSLQGGNNLCGKAEILLRTGTGSLVNALSACVEFPISDAEVISKVNAALATCDKDAIGAEAYLRDQDNNLGCPINQAGVCSND